MFPSFPRHSTIFHFFLFHLLFSTFPCAFFARSPPHFPAFGEHRAPEEERVVEYEGIEELSSYEFFERHVWAREPAMFRGAAKNWSLGVVWDDAYLDRVYGNLTVLVEDKKDNRDVPAGEMLLSEFLSRYKQDSLFLVSQTPSPMLEEIPLFPLLNVAALQGHLTESNVWLSAGGTVSTMHEDADDNVNCLLQGTKLWFFVKEQYRDLLAMEDPKLSSAFSVLDMDALDIQAHPEILKAPYRTLEAHAGDCVYLPSVYPHHVRSLPGRNLAVTLLFDPPPKTTQPSAFIPHSHASRNLSDAGLRWTYAGTGKEDITMGLEDDQVLRDQFLLAIGEEDGGVLLVEGLEEALDSHVREHLFGRTLLVDKVKEYASKIHTILLHSAHGSPLTKATISSLSRQALQHCLRLVETCLSHACATGLPPEVDAASPMEPDAVEVIGGSRVEQRFVQDVVGDEGLEYAAPLSVEEMSELVLDVEDAENARKRGQGRPLGAHRKPEGKIRVVDRWLSPKELFRDHVAQREPVLMRGVMRDEAPATRWTDEVLSTEYGELQVRMEEKVEGTTRTPKGNRGIGRSTLKDVMERYQSDAENVYVVSQLPAPMYREVRLPPSLDCDPVRSRVLESNLWISNGATRSIIHRDAHNFINCVMDGTKSWLFFDDSMQPYVPMEAEATYEAGGASLVDVDEVDFEEDPQFAHVRYRTVTMHPGDCVFCPGRYLHQVTTPPGRSLAVAFLFAERLNDSEINCDAKDDEWVSLEDSGVVWTFQGDDTPLSLGNIDPEAIRAELGLIASIECEDGVGLVGCVVERLLDLLGGSYAPEEAHVWQLLAHAALPTCSSLPKTITPLTTSKTSPPHLNPSIFTPNTLSTTKALLSSCIHTSASFNNLTLTIPPSSLHALAGTFNVDPSNTIDAEFAVVDPKKVEEWVRRGGPFHNTLKSAAKLRRESKSKEALQMLRDATVSPPDFATSYATACDGTFYTGLRLFNTTAPSNSTTLSLRDWKSANPATSIVQKFSDAHTQKLFDHQRESAFKKRHRRIGKQHSAGALDSLQGPGMA